MVEKRIKKAASVASIIVAIMAAINVSVNMESVNAAELTKEELHATNIVTVTTAAMPMPQISVEGNRVKRTALMMPTTVTKDINTIVYDIPKTDRYKGKKTFESYKKITKYAPGDLQKEAITDENGFRKIDGYYMIALGSHFGTQIGQRIDLILENETVIECVMGDTKDDSDTDESNIFTVKEDNSDCCSEFIVDVSMIPSEAKYHGDVSYAFEDWASPVSQIIVY